MLAALWFRIFLIPFSIKDENIKIKPQHNFANSFANLGLLHSGKNWWKFQDNGNFVSPWVPCFLTKEQKRQRENIFLACAITYVVGNDLLECLHQ